MTAISGVRLFSFDTSRPEGRLGARDRASVLDLGGLPRTSGGRVAAGRVVHSLTPHDGILDVIASVGARTVLDLRPHEAFGRQPPDRPTVRWDHLPGPIELGAGEPVDLSARVRGDGPEIARALRILADDANQPTVIHAPGAAERAALFVTVILLAVGVAPTPTFGFVSERLGASRSAVADAIDVVMRHGGVVPWLAANGCDAHDLSRVRRNLIEFGSPYSSEKVNR